MEWIGRDPLGAVNSFGTVQGQGQVVSVYPKDPDPQKQAVRMRVRPLAMGPGILRVDETPALMDVLWGGPSERLLLQDIFGVATASSYCEPVTQAAELLGFHRGISE